ncbi:DUF2652 domain-containing protein [bacterium SCSIO 12741]|nr:DUF2652 domain-containing protein [bacterium SCSIO 12741]
MSHSLLFLPDISGYTEFVQTTEVEHSQHVIAELLEVMMEANSLDLQLAEVEGDALFFYREAPLPSMEMLLAQVERIFSAFYSHLKLLETNRICPCNACATAPNLQLKIVAHCGPIQFLELQGKRKPFGPAVIQVHRLLKNSVDSNNYVLLSKDLTDELNLPENYRSRLFDFASGSDTYDGNELPYLYSKIAKEELKLQPFRQVQKTHFDDAPNLKIKLDFPVPAAELFEYITNYNYRYLWADGVDRYEFNENTVTRVGSEHVCVINDKHLNFVTVVKEGEPGQLVYGELTSTAPFLRELYQFFIVTPRNDHSCTLESEIFVRTGVFQKLIWSLIMKRIFDRNLHKVLGQLLDFVKQQKAAQVKVSPTP